MPPDVTIISPVVYFASSETRYATAPAHSSGSPSLQKTSVYNYQLTVNLYSMSTRFNKQMTVLAFVFFFDICGV
jgi:hypothetical protein